MDKADPAVKLHRAAFHVSRIWALPWVLLLANVGLGVWTLSLAPDRSVLFFVRSS